MKLLCWFLSSRPKAPAFVFMREVESTWRGLKSVLWNAIHLRSTSHYLNFIFFVAMVNLQSVVNAKSKKVLAMRNDTSRRSLESWQAYLLDSLDIVWHSYWDCRVVFAFAISMMPHLGGHSLSSVPTIVNPLFEDPASGTTDKTS